jgi:hypothetical protein
MLEPGISPCGDVKETPTVAIAENVIVAPELIVAVVASDNATVEYTVIVSPRAAVPDALIVDI